MVPRQQMRLTPVREDPVWMRIRGEAEEIARHEPTLAGFVHSSILRHDTLGGTGKEEGDRHPKIRRGVLLGAGAKILGNIEVGQCSRVAAGSVVVRPVPRNVTVAGVPARVVGEAGCAEPSVTMDQMLSGADD